MQVLFVGRLRVFIVLQEIGGKGLKTFTEYRCLVG